MKKHTEIIIKISTLSLVIILGLIAVFPQSLELKDFIFNDIKESFQKQNNKLKSTASSTLKSVKHTSFDVKTNFLKNFKGRKIRVEKLEKVLSRYFQERLIKLECIGNYQKFYRNDLKVKSESTLMTFKAKVRIDGIDKTAVGKIQVHVNLISGMWSSPHLSFQGFLKEWHFTQSNETYNQYCEKENIFLDRKTSSFKFFEMNDKFGVLNNRLSKELEINKELCISGEQKYCEYNADYEKVRMNKPRSWGSYEAQKIGKKKYDKVIQDFAKRYYSRLCKQNVNFACAQTTKEQPNAHPQ